MCEIRSDKKVQERLNYFDSSYKMTDTRTLNHLDKLKEDFDMIATAFLLIIP